MGDPEKTVDAAAMVEAKKAETAAKQKAYREEAAKKANGQQKPEAHPPIDLLMRVANPEKIKPGWKKVLEGRPNNEDPKWGKPKPKIESDVLEELLNDVEKVKAAVEAEALPAKSELGPEELKRRRMIRWLKLNQINARCAVIRSFGGKCVIVTQGRSRYNPDKKVFDFQSKEAFQQWMANEFIPSLEEEKKVDAVGPWWWRHRKRRQFAGVVFKPLAPEEVKTPDGQKLFNMWLGWGVEEKQGDWSLIRNHIKVVLANNDAEADDYIIRWIAWAIQHPDCTADVALVLIGEKGTGKGTRHERVRVGAREWTGDSLSGGQTW